jgi:hypothetical protein
MLQLLLVGPYFFASAVVIEMTFAEAEKGYLSSMGLQVKCEALAPRGRSSTKPRCASFGSKETNPFGYVTAIVALGGLSTLLWWSGQPGRGLRWGK